MKYKAVIFDLDGTLAYTIHDLADSMNRVLIENGFPTHITDQYRFFVGKGIRSLVFNALPFDFRDEQMVDKCLTQFMREYEMRYLNKTKLYEGVPELISGLKHLDVMMAVLSNKKDEFTIRMVNKFFGDDTFKIVMGASDRFPSKPSPVGANYIREHFMLDSNEILFVGDSNTDMQTANAAGMIACGVLWGYRSREELIESGANFLVSNPSQILEIVSSPSDTKPD